MKEVVFTIDYGARGFEVSDTQMGGQEHSLILSASELSVLCAGALEFASEIGATSHTFTYTEAAEKALCGREGAIVPNVDGPP